MSPVKRWLTNLLMAAPVLSGHPHVLLAESTEENTENISVEEKSIDDTRQPVELSTGNKAMSSPQSRRRRVKLIIGGSSEDGRAKQLTMPVER